MGSNRTRSLEHITMVIAVCTLLVITAASPARPKQKQPTPAAIATQPAATTTLPVIGDPELNALADTLLANQNPGEMDRAVVRLRGLGSDAQAIIPRLAPMFSDRLRWDLAVKVLHAIRSPATLDPLQKIIEQATKARNQNLLIAAALHAMGDVGPDAAPILRNIFDHGRLPQQGEILVALGRTGPEALPDILKYGAQDPSLSMFTRQAEMLASVQSYQTLVQLWRTVSQPERTSVIQAIGEIGIPALAPTLEAMDDKDPHLRRIAGQGAVGIVYGSMIRLDPKDNGGQHPPAIVLQILRSHRAQLMKLSKSRDTGEALSASELVRLAGSDPVIAGGDLTSPETRVRYDAVQSIVRVADLSHTRDLERMAQRDPDLVVREAAAVALVELPEPDHAKRLHDALEGDDAGLAIEAGMWLMRQPQGTVALLHAMNAATPMTRDRLAYAIKLQPPQYQSFIDAFNSGDAGARLPALQLIALNFTANARITDSDKAVAGMIAMLNDPSHDSARWAARALSAIGPSSISPLLTALKSKESVVRGHAAESLAAIRPLPAKAVQPLTDAIQDSVVDVALCAAGALANTREKGVPVFVELMKDKNPDRRAIAVEGCIAASATGSIESIAALKAAVTDTDARVRNSAITFVGPHDQMIAEDQARFHGVDHPPSAHRESLSVEQLVAVVQDPHYFVLARKRAVGMLIHHGSAAAPATAALNQLLVKETDLEFRAAVVNALGAIGPAASGAVPTLMNAMDECDPIAIPAIQALGQIGPAAKNATPKLARLMTAFYSTRAQWAAQALTRIGEPAVPALVALLKAPEPVPTQAAIALREMGPPAAKAVPALRQLLRDAPAGRAMWAETLGMIGAASAVAVPDLIPMIQSTDPADQRAAMGAVKNIGPPAASAALIDALVVYMQNNRDGYEAVLALGGLGPAAAPAAPVLINAIQSVYDRQRAAKDEFAAARGFGSPSVELYAIRALGQIGPSAASAIPLLTKVSNQVRSGEAQVAARRAISLLRGEEPKPEPAAPPRNKNLPPDSGPPAVGA